MNIVFYITIFAIGIIVGNIYRYALKMETKGLGILTGTLMVLFTISMKLDINNIKIYNITTLIFIMLYLIFLISIAIKDKEKRNIEKIILAYGIAISIIYIIYLCIIEKTNIYRYPIYLVLIILILLIDNINTKKKAENNYTIGVIMLITIMLIFTGEFISILTIIMSFVTISIYIIISKIKNKKRYNNQKYSANIKIGLILAITNIITFLFNLLYTNIQF